MPYGTRPTSLSSRAFEFREQGFRIEYPARNGSERRGFHCARRQPAAACLDGYGGWMDLLVQSALERIHGRHTGRDGGLGLSEDRGLHRSMPAVLMTCRVYEDIR